MSLITSEKLDAMFIAYHTGWEKAYSATPVFWEKIATEAPSSTRSNTYAFASQLPRLEKVEGERIAKSLATHSYTLTNETYEGLVKVQREDIEDDQYGVYTTTFSQYGEQAAKWPDDMLVTLLNQAESVLCFDGQSFFDVDHPIDLYDSSKGTYANLLTTFALTPDNYADARRRMRLFKGNNGRPLGVRPTLLVVPPQLEDRAKKIVESNQLATATLEGQTQVGASDNIYKGTTEILVIDELGDSPNDWYLMDTGRAIKPFVVQIREQPAFQRFWSPTDPGVFFLNEYLMGARGRGVAGVTLPFLAMKCKG